MLESNEKMLNDTMVAVGALALSASVGLLLAFPIKWAWNYTLVPFFSLPVIGWGHAWCLHFLAGTLLKSTLHQRNKKEGKVV